ncbi:MAG TPA: sodium:solute symporter family protein [Candidatus Eremiobacteraceae bacterium]|nr:sodium:solute symporter family protein [Candidatus Eremiobacteraceae bacterium]
MIDWTALAVFVVLFGFVTVLGFAAANWQRGDLEELHEWALAGRRFSTLVTWFLLGGDIYTAYTFVALPALAFGVGAPAFFALPYTTIVFPLAFVIAPRLWAIAKRRHYITYADFARERYDSKSVEIIVAITGIVATMLYIALQLVGLQVVIRALGLSGPGLVGDLPVIIAFAILAMYTYRGGLRAPTLVAIVKDILIYVTVITAVIYIPWKLGGFAPIFAAANAALAALQPKPGSIMLQPAGYFSYASLALGSGFALLMYPHVMTGWLSSKDGDVLRRNMAILPAYSILLGIIALFGYMVIAAGLHPATPNDAVPTLFAHLFPSWFTGVALAAIGIGALVPAAVMSIAAANLYTRNIHRTLFGAATDPRQETSIAKTASLVVKIGALVAVLTLPAKFSIYYQLFAGALILQTLPAVLFGLYTPWFHRRALLAGWIVGMTVAIWMIVANKFASVFPLHVVGTTYTGFIGLWSVLTNIVVCVALTWIFDAARVARGADKTTAADYEDSGAPTTA